MKVTATITVTSIMRKEVEIEVEDNATADDIDTQIKDEAFRDPMYSDMEKRGWELLDTLSVEVECAALVGRD